MDPDRPVRIALKDDVTAVLKKLDTKVDAILVSGDIAYQADPEEYQVAAEWLDELAENVGCKPLNVFTVPGNHDVDRRAIHQNHTLQALRSHLSSVDCLSRSTLIFELLDDKEAGPTLMLPLEAYNQFAARYECATYPPKPFWRYDLEQKLGPSHTLRLHGLNSVMMSGPDDDVKGTLFVGNIQTAIEPDERVVDVIIMHHPPDWLEDCDDVEDAINNGARIQLVGHKHRQRIRMDQNAVRLMAAAVNPSRIESNWEPGYNLISVEVEDDNTDVWLHVNSHVRVWQSSPDRFVPKLGDEDASIWYKRYRLGASKPEEEVSMESNGEVSVAPEAPVETANSGSRELVFRFWNLRPSQRRKIANDLTLLTLEDLSLPEFERYRRAFVRARESDQIQRLAEAITAAEGT